MHSMGVNAVAFECDITDVSAIDHVVQETVAQFGTIDILVNNSGTSWSGPLWIFPRTSGKKY